MKSMIGKMGAGANLQIPYPTLKIMGTTFTAYEPQKSLSARFPFNPEFTNPMHIYHGGFLTAAVDEVFGPLSYMTAERPVVTIELSTSFLRPFLEKDEWMEVRAEVISKTKSLLTLRAEVKSKAGKLLATSTAHCLVVNDDNLKKSR